MPDTVDPARASYVKSIETTTGKPLGRGKMCSHRVFVTTPDDIDDELLAFVRAAYEASA